MAEILTEEYVAGLCDVELCKLMCREEPKNLEEAMQIVDVENMAASPALQIQGQRADWVEVSVQIEA